MLTFKQVSNNEHLGTDFISPSGSIYKDICFPSIGFGKFKPLYVPTYSIVSAIGSSFFC